MINHHVDSNCRCLVAHYDKDGKLLSSCIQCAKCKEWIRPEDWDKPCLVQEDKE